MVWNLESKVLCFKLEHELSRLVTSTCCTACVSPAGVELQFSLVIEWHLGCHTACTLSGFRLSGVSHTPDVESKYYTVVLTIVPLELIVLPILTMFTSQ